MSFTPLPSSLATCKIRKGDYVELFYFTNFGLAEAEMTAHSVDDEALTLTRDGEGLHSFILVAAAKTKDSVIQDKDLTWAQIDEAAPRMLQAMKENGWDDERVQSHLKFWMALSAHGYRHSPDEYGKHALIAYQAFSRRRWHDTLGTTSSFDLQLINEEMITTIQQDLVHKVHKAATEQAIQVSTTHALHSPPC